MQYGIYGETLRGEIAAWSVGVACEPTVRQVAALRRQKNILYVPTENVYSSAGLTVPSAATPLKSIW